MPNQLNQLFWWSPSPSEMQIHQRLAVMAIILLLGGCKNTRDEVPVQGFSAAKVIIGYVPGFRGVLNTAEINPNKITHINYAFVNVKDSAAFLTNISTDTINFRKLNELKRLNPHLKIMLSIGGWSWSENFSDAVLTSTSRRKFTESCLALLERFYLDGIDIDWEYPGMKGEDNVFRPEDRQHFTLMFKELRQALDVLSTHTGRTYTLTTALPCFEGILTVTDMHEASKYLDYINLMGYDFYVSGDKAGHHANLYASESYGDEDSVDKAFNLYTAAGVSPDKLVLGVPFYGRSWIMKSDDNRGINRAVESVANGGGYTFIHDTLIHQSGFVRYWDEKAKAPYLWNAAKRQLVSYEDEESIREKCNFVKSHNMAGMMFWQYASDPREYLLDAMNTHLYH